jgi:hypothetical protein
MRYVILLEERKISLCINADLTILGHERRSSKYSNALERTSKDGYSARWSGRTKHESVCKTIGIMVWHYVCCLQTWLRVCIRADLNCAIAMGTNPVFSGLEPDPEYDQAGHLSTADDAISQKPLVPMNRDTKVETLNIVLKESFDNLKMLTQINGSKREPISIDKEESRRDSDSLYRTERSLLTLSNIWGPRKFVTSGSLAAMIYTDNQIRGINFRARIMDRVIERLQDALGMVMDDISQHDLKDNATRAILWVLIVGGVAADYRACRGWFLERILDFCDVLDMRTWKDTEEMLQRFLWPAAWHKPGYHLWEDVEECRLMKYMSFPEAPIADQGNVDEQGDALEWF